MGWFDGATQHNGTLSGAIKTLFIDGLFVVARALTILAIITYMH
jgi:hypothetical protein